ncbi:SDR family NAD(P)-dependent oxidoreductase [uncultured bacterium]|uniref:SDR family NAD(P)-dependent oxidoreductase n=2 Tax=Acetilactobacillus jinshanensis TaxID=1720083 RepID=A0A4P6ZNM1_9LACO|nr:SDR family NAD(P)-dependent oxidoreductase [Acetilactobacillus jinshanensis]URL61909.1 SDR family NAD(P)-dependent oxidoreductase [uncultured bacterium]
MGKQVAILLAKAGNTVYGGARHLDKMKDLEKLGIHTVQLDVTDPTSCQVCVEQILHDHGRIDVLINCAGYGSFGPVEEVPIQEAKNQINVNVLGIARLSKLVIPSMRKHQFGKIINLASIAGKVPMHFGDWYNVSKYAVEALSSDMRIELSPFGIQVIIIEPGIIKTPWGKIAANHLIKTVKGDVYEKPGMKMAHTLEHMYRPDGNATAPIKIARVICDATVTKKPKARYLVGRYAKLIVFLHAILPTSWFDHIMQRV